MTKLIIPGLLISTLLLATSCGSGSSTSTTPTTPASTTAGAPTTSTNTPTNTTTTTPATAADPSVTVMDISAAPISEAQKAMITLINTRRAAGAFCPATVSTDGTVNKVWYPPVAALSWNSALEQGATNYAQDMVTYNYYHHDHTDHAGVDFATRARAYNLLATALSENTGMGFDNSATGIGNLVTSWLNSTSGHCQTLMNANMTRIGLGYLTGNNTEYWVADFSN